MQKTAKNPQALRTCREKSATRAGAHCHTIRKATPVEKNVRTARETRRSPAGCYRSHSASSMRACSRLASDCSPESMRATSATRSSPVTSESTVTGRSSLLRVTT